MAQKTASRAVWGCQYNAGMRVTYDPQADAMYIYLLRDSDVARTQELRPGIILDYDDKGRVIGIEVLDASANTSNPREVTFELLI